MATTHEECGKEIHEPAASCAQCGAPLGISWSSAATEPGDGIPPGVQGWSWGAFLLNVFWALANRTWIGLLMFVPYLWFVIPFVLGYKGREWAWKNRRWESLEEFNRVQRQWSAAGLVTVCTIAALAYIAVPAHRDFTVKAKLYTVSSTLDTVRTAVARAYRDKGRIPPMHTIVTAANQGQPATPDWAALGFRTLPALPPVVKRLEFSMQESPEIVVELDRISETINGTTVRAKLSVAGKQLSWQHEATSSNAMVAQFFHYSDGIVRDPVAPALGEQCH